MSLATDFGLVLLLMLIGMLDDDAPERLAAKAIEDSLALSPSLSLSLSLSVCSDCEPARAAQAKPTSSYVAVAVTLSPPGRDHQMGGPTMQSWLLTQQA